MNNEFIIIGIIMITLSIAILSYVFGMLNNVKQNRNNNYNHELNRVEYNEMREFYESKIYDLNQKLMEDKERWSDVNHLIIKGNTNIIDKDNINKSILEPNRFLMKHGLTDKDMEVKSNEVFVLTSFMDEYRETYNTIKNVCEELTLKCSKSDDEYIENDILKHILKKMARARIIIANIDGRNANVFYELGIAHALDKPTIMVSRNKNKIPFDLQSKNILFYNDFFDLEKKLMIEINKIVLNRDVD